MKNVFSKNVLVMGLVLSMMAMVACSGQAEKDKEADTSKMDETEAVTQSSGNNAMDAQSETANKTADGKLNINTATGEAFRTIPNVGDKMVHEFDEYRPYVSIRQFRKEIGKYVDKDQIAEYENYIYVPVAPNESDAQTIMQLPGIDEEEASELIANRPYDTNQEFIEAVRLMVNDEELVRAKAYLKAE